MSLSKAIRLKCLDCVCGSAKEVAACPCFECSLWQHRFGCRPATVRTRNPRLLDPVFVVLAGAVEDEGADMWCRDVMANPRKYLPPLRRFTDERIAEVIAEIKAIPRGERFKLGRKRHPANMPANRARCPLAATSFSETGLDDPEHLPASS